MAFCSKRLALIFRTHFVCELSCCNHISGYQMMLEPYTRWQFPPLHDADVFSWIPILDLLFKEEDFWVVVDCHTRWRHQMKTLLAFCTGNSPVPPPPPPPHTHTHTHWLFMFSLICVWINRWVNNREETKWPPFRRRYFQTHFFNENVRIFIKISLTFVPKGPINDNPALVQIMAWRRSGDKPLSEPMTVSLLTHIYVTRSQWVKINKATIYFTTMTS